MKIAIDGFIYQGQRFGGISRVFSEILPRMCELDEHLSIDLFTVGKPVRPVPAHQRIRHRKIPRVENLLRPNRLFASLLPGMRKMVKQMWLGGGKGRIWHSTYFTMPEKWQGRQVVTVHDMIYERFPDMYNDSHSIRLRKDKVRCIENADAVICISETTRADLEKVIPLVGKAVYVIYPAASTIFRKMPPWKLAGSGVPAKPFILYVGMRSHNKNFDLLARAYSQWGAGKDVDLVVVGNPWTAEEVRQLKSLALFGRIRLKTGIDDPELCRLYNLASGLVYPSVYEGFGIPMVEAMACGCPVIASRIPSTVEVAGDFPCYFDLSDTQSLLHELDQAMHLGRDPGKIKMGMSRARFYSWDKSAAHTLEVYRYLSSD